VLLEREPELEAVDAALAAARGGSGGLVLVEGPAGRGKSALLGAAVERARAAGMRVLSGRGRELERELPFGVALELFEGGRVAPLEGESLPSIRALHRLVGRLAEGGPLLVAVDDVHAADEPSLRFLLYLSARVEGLPVTLVATALPPDPSAAGEVAAELARVAATRLALRALSRAAVEALAGAAPGAAVAEAVWEATRGNPFLVHELLRAAALLGEPSAERMRELAPEPVTLSVAARLERLPRPVRAVADALAVLPEPSPLRDVAELAGIAPREAARAVDALAALGLLEPGGRPAFAHPLERRAVHQTIGATARAEAHARAAAILRGRGAPAAAIAGQLLDAAPGADAAAVEELRAAAAAADAVASGAGDAAIRYLRRALAEPPPPAELPGLLLDLGRLESAGGDPGGVARLEQALAASGEEGAARVLLELGRVLEMRGRRAEALAVLERGCAGVDPEQRELGPELAAAYAFAGAFGAGRAGGVGTAADAGDPDEDTPGDRALIAVAAARTLVEGGPRERVVELAARAWRGGARVTELGPEAVHAAHLALFLAGEPARGMEVLDRAVEEASRRGSVLACSLARQLRAQACRRSGRLADAIADAESALDAMRGDWSAILPATRAAYALAVLERGDPAAAERLLAAAGPPGDVPGAALVDEARGWLSLAVADAAGARDAFLSAGAGLLDLGWVNPAVSPWRAGAAIAHSLTGDGEQAERLAAEELELARAFGAPAALGVSLRAAGLVRGGDAGLDLLRQAVAVLAGSGFELEHARALVDLGAALRRAGHSREARERLERGMGLAHRLEGALLERRAADELRALGARPRRGATVGPAALTPSERRVASMAAEGMTNREIAQALFVTRKAVEWHLRNAYAKLEIHSRAELEDALRDGAPRAA
jgi:DNA-binding CsgD family transcriptional regulator